MVCHLGVYGVHCSGIMILQCLFLEVVDEETLRTRLRTLLVRGPDVTKDRQALAALRRSYLSNLIEPESERAAFLARRSSLLAGTLTRSSALVSVLSRPFRFVSATLDDAGVEILSASFENSRLSVRDVLCTYDVARLVAVGSYDGDEGNEKTCAGLRLGGSDGRAPMAPGVKSSVRSCRIGRGVKTEGAAMSAQAPRTASGERQTHANRKASSSFGVREITFSLRVGGRRFVFGSGNSPQTADDVFEVKDLVFMGLGVRLATPKAFFAVIFTEDQCLLLMRYAMVHLYNLLYSDFTGLKPLFDYLGPEFFPRGAERSVFFPGFPNVHVYSVPTSADMRRETVYDAAEEALSECGLPDIVGPEGKLEVERVRPGPARLPRAEVDVFFSPLRKFRVNGAHFHEREYSDGADREMLSVCVGDGVLYRVSFPDLRETLLRFYLRSVDAQLGRCGGQRRSIGDLCTRFLQRLEHRSRDFYAYVRSLENFLSHHVTSACTTAGMCWVLVHQDSDFYVSEAAGGCSAPENCVRTIFGCYWRKLFGPDVPEPACFVTEKAPKVLVLSNNRLISTFRAARQDDGDDGNWLDATARTLVDVYRLLSQDLEWVGVENLHSEIRKLVLYFVGKRHCVDFWLERFDPAREAVLPHCGLLDSSPFFGVRAEGGAVALQSRESALSDRVSYHTYVRKVFMYVRACTIATIRHFGHRKEESLLESLIAGAAQAIATTESQITTDYMGLFKIN